MDRYQASKRKEDIDKRINEIKQKREKPWNILTEKEKKHKNEVSDGDEDENEDEEEIRNNIKIKQKIVKYIRESETEVFYFYRFIIGRNQT